jgi:hypothetical protein
MITTHPYGPVGEWVVQSDQSAASAPLLPSNPKVEGVSNVFVFLLGLCHVNSPGWNDGR